ATITDAAGNATSDTIINELVIDTTPPTAPTVTALTTNSTTPTITGTATPGVGESMTVTVGGATYNVIPSGGIWSLDLSIATATSGSLSLNVNGTNQVIATVIDTAGNTVTDATTGELIIDTTAPGTPTVNALTTNSTTPTINGTATLGVGENMTVTVGGATYNVIPSGGIWSLDLSTATAASGSLSLNTNGTNQVVATITDAASNAASDATTGELIISDTTPPAVPVISAPAAGASLISTTPTISGTGEAGATLKVFDTDGTTLIGTTTVDGAGNWTLISASLTQSSHTLHVKQTDAAGNVSPEKTVSFSIASTSASTNASTLDIAAGHIFKVQTITPSEPTLSVEASSALTSGVEIGGTPVIDAVQQSASQSTLADSSIATLNTPVDAANTPEPGQATNDANAFDINALPPSGAGNEQQAAKGSTNQAARAAPDENPGSLNVDATLQNQINLLSPDSFFVNIPGGAALIGDIIYTATRPDGSILPDYIHIDPATGKITILRHLAPVGVSDVAIKVSRIIQSGEQKDVNSTSFKITVDKSAKVKLGNENVTPKANNGA
ncbi:MAG: Ig-like domain-containing protein, partial [Mariprofundaceae bacterium]